MRIISLFLGILVLIFLSCGEKSSLSIPPNPCDTAICNNGGYCQNGNCVCPSGWGGPNCSEKLPEVVFDKSKKRFVVIDNSIIYDAYYDNSKYVFYGCPASIQDSFNVPCPNLSSCKRVSISNICSDSSCQSAIQQYRNNKCDSLWNLYDSVISKDTSPIASYRAVDFLGRIPDYCQTNHPELSIFFCKSLSY